MSSSILISPFKTGLDTDLEPWIAPPDSFSTFDNFHIRHNAVEKRNGYRQFAQLQGTASSIAINGVTTANPAEVTTASPHGYSTGNKVFIAGVDPDSNSELNNKIFTITVTGASTFTIGSAYTDTYSTGGTVALQQVSTDRVMGIYRFIKTDNSKETLAFNTMRANRFNTVSEAFEVMDSAAIMSGSDTDYIWAENWQSTGNSITTPNVNRLYFTNGKIYNGSTVDGIRYYDGTSNSTTLFTPSLGGTRTLYGCKMMFAIKQRLLCLYIHEDDSGTAKTYPQRARWCAAQNPDNWNDTVAGGGGYVDAPTGEHIISARALQDVIIVFLTNSVWTIRPVPDPALPFRWDKINDFRACDSRMGTVQYDRYIAALGVRGITGTDGVSTQRIDERIQDFTEDLINVDEFQKVFCLRDYNNRRWWTLYPYLESTENNRALIYDDDSKSYSQYTIAMNCLGYGNFARDYGLDDFTAANDLDLSIEDFTNETLQSYYWQDNQETLLGGSIGGFVYIMDTEGNDDGTDIECQLFTNAWNPYQQENKECRMPYIDIFVDTDKQTQLLIEFFKDTDTSPYKIVFSDLLPPLGFITEIANISKANPAQVTASSHGLATGDQVYIYGVKGMTAIEDGFTITYVDDNNFTLDGVDSSAFSVYKSGGQVVKRQYFRTKVWKRIIAGGVGFQHRMKITSEGDSEPLRIHAFKPHFKPIGKRTIN